MKSARERAEEANRLAHASVNPVGEIERMFQEHARDQRHIVAECVSEFHDVALGSAHAAAMNAPAPGEQR